MTKYTYDLIEKRQYRLSVEGDSESDAYDTAYENYYNGIYNENLEENPCGFELILVKSKEEDK